MLFFVSKSDIWNFARDNTLSSCGIILGDILHNRKFSKMVQGKLIKTKSC